MAKRTPQPPETWANRIVGTADVDPRTLAENPMNFKIHTETQQAAMSGAFNEIGWIQSVTINRLSQRCLDGHMRIALAIQSNQPTVPVSYVELTPEEEARALASLDKIGAMFETDYGKMADLLAQTGGIEDEGLASFFQDLRTENDQFMMAAVGNGTGSSTADKRAAGVSERGKAIKALLFAPELATFEAALKATGIRDRGRALIEVCRVYLEAKATGRVI